MRDLFLLEPGLVFLNHGSFGACPRPVFDEYQRRQRELELNPVEFLARSRRFPELIESAKESLAHYVGADPANLVFVRNATAGVNVAARSLRLEPGDEVLATNEEYGALDYLWEHVCARAGARYIRVPVAELAGSIGERTRALFFSHVTSQTALVHDVAGLVEAARTAGIVSIVDGAHAPGQVPLDLERLGADFYSGNCHKWMCAPKGSGFLHVRPEHHDSIEPLVVSWDFGEGESFAHRHRYQGTADPAAYLAVPAAIAFQAEHDWDAQRERCRDLAERARIEIAAIAGTEPQPPQPLQMASVPLPPGTDAATLQQRVFEEHRVEVVCFTVRGEPYLRASFQAYNGESDLEALLAALREEL